MADDGQNKAPAPAAQAAGLAAAAPRQPVQIQPVLVAPAQGAPAYKQELSAYQTILKKITTVDGLSPGAVQQWVLAIDIYKTSILRLTTITAPLVRLIRDTTVGGLGMDIERWLTHPGTQFNPIDWAILRRYILQKYVAHDPEGRLEQKLYALKQAELETERAYVLRVESIVRMLIYDLSFVKGSYNPLPAYCLS